MPEMRKEVKAVGKRREKHRSPDTDKCESHSPAPQHHVSQDNGQVSA